MNGSQAVLGTIQDREAAAFYVDGRLDDLLIDSDRPRLGTIYRAKATRPVKGQGGMFFETPDGSMYLRGGKGIAPGDVMLLQVSGYAEPGKAIPVTSKLLFKSRYAIVTPEAPGVNISRAIKDDEARLAIRAAAETELAEASGFGIILRSACLDADPDEIASDVDAMVGLAQAVLQDPDQGLEKLLEGAGPHDIAWRDWGADSTIEESLDDALDGALRSHTPLPGGGSIVVEQTRALIAVDVNSGPDTSHAAGLKVNIAAARALPRALRLQGLGGQIVVDFAPMPKKDRRGLESVLRSALRLDDVETALIGWTTMGLFELSRKRARVPLIEVLT